jgi:nucleotide-sensitive chloride channel 1A
VHNALFKIFLTRFIGQKNFSALIFASNSGHGFEIKYPAITLHAISRAESRPCIYCQIDEGDVAEDAEDDKIRELKIFPSSEASRSWTFQKHPSFTFDLMI